MAIRREAPCPSGSSDSESAEISSDGARLENLSDAIVRSCKDGSLTHAYDAVRIDLVVCARQRSWHGSYSDAANWELGIVRELSARLNLKPKSRMRENRKSGSEGSRGWQHPWLT